MKFMPWDWRCTGCDSVFEEWAKPDTAVLPCPECNRDAKRLISAPRLDPKLGLDPEGFPTMEDKWARTRIQRRKHEDKIAAKNDP